MLPDRATVTLAD